MGKLSATRIKSLVRPGLYGDGGTLHLRVAGGGSRSWVQRIVIRGRCTDIGLGGYPLVSLSEARTLAEQYEALCVAVTWSNENLRY